LLANDRESPTKIPWLAIGALVAVNALWGFSFPVMKSINELMDLHFRVTESNSTSAYLFASSAWMIAVRFTIAFAMICVCLNALVRKATRAEWIAGFWIAVFFYVGLVLQVIGLAMIPASRSGFLTSLTTVFTPFLGAIVFRRIPSLNMFIGAMVAVAGVAALTGLFVATRDHIGIAPDAHQRWTPGDTLTTIGSFMFVAHRSLWQTAQFHCYYTQHVSHNSRIGLANGCCHSLLSCWQLDSC
jgi:drug/metabolite transporter (DMT)-like permease